MSRAHDVGAAAHVEPLTYHNTSVSLGDRQQITLAFGQPQQFSLDSLRFDDSSSWKEIPRGKGHIFWASYPVELAENLESTAQLYSYVTSRLKITPMFTQQTPLPPGVLVFPTVLADSVLYVFVSDSANDTPISLRDQMTDAPISFSLRAEHAAIVVVGKKEKKIVAKYGF
jgi:hypothetical protein